MHRFGALTRYEALSGAFCGVVVGTTILTTCAARTATTTNRRTRTTTTVFVVRNTFLGCLNLSVNLQPNARVGVPVSGQV